MVRRRLGGGGGGGGGDDGRASFAAAVRAGDVAAVRVALAANTTLGRVPLDGTTPPLHEASKLGHHVVVEELLRAGAAVDVADKYGMTPLRVAAAEGHEDVVEQLLRVGAGVDAADKDGMTPLQMAAGGGDTDVAEQLLRAGATVDAADKNGMTPLYVASSLGHADVAEQLLRAGAAVDAADKDGRTPLHVAAGGGHADVAEQLLRAGAAVDVADKDGSTPLHAAAKMALIRADDDVHSRALEAVRVLVAWGAVVSDDVRPSAVSASRTRGKRLRTVLSTTRVLSPEEVRDAKAEWSAAAATAKDEVTAVSAAATALAELRKVHDGFLAAPETLTLVDIKEELLRGRIRDVRCLRLAHRMLLFADRVGVFACEDRAVMTQRRHDLFEQVYQPAVGWLDTGDRGLVAAIVRHAADQGLVERVHLSIMGVALELDHKFSTQLKAVVERLNCLESAMTTAGQLLCDTMQELRDLKEHVIEKEELDGRVALAKSAVKIGVSLAPIVGAALNAGVDVAAVFADGTTELAVVCRHLVDPADIGAARQILQRVSDASSTLPAAKLEQLQAAVRPYASLEDVNVDLEFAEQALVDAGVEDEGVLADMPQAEDGRVLTDPSSDQAEDRYVKFKDVVTDVAIDHCVEEAAAQKRGRAQPGSAKPAPKPVAGTAGALDSGSVHVPASTSTCRRPPARSRPAASDEVGTSAAPLTNPSPPRPPSSLAPADDVTSPVASPSSRPIAHAPEELVGAAGVPAMAPCPGGGGSSLDTDFGAPFFAGVKRWDWETLAAKLVDYVACGYTMSDRAAFGTLVRGCAKAHAISGAAVVRCSDPAVTAAYLLGDEKGRHGMVESVKSFIRDAKRYDTLS